jgi:hypothetical protein
MKHRSSISSIVAAAVLTACASSAAPLSELTMAKTILEPALLSPNPQGASLLIKRDLGGYNLRKCTHRLSLDGKPFADVQYGEAVLIYPPVGDHILSLTMPQLGCRYGDSEVNIAIKAGVQLVFRTMSTPDGKSVLQPTAF